MTYMRGGSSFFGELINHNPDGCYWYEPMEAFYHAMYGMIETVLPLDMFYHNNATKRYVYHSRSLPRVDGLFQSGFNKYFIGFNLFFMTVSGP